MSASRSLPPASGLEALQQRGGERARGAFSIVVASSVHACVMLALPVIAGPTRSPATQVSQLVEVEIEPLQPAARLSEQVPHETRLASAATRSSPLRRGRGAASTARATPAAPAAHGAALALASTGEPLDFTAGPAAVGGAHGTGTERDVGAGSERGSQSGAAARSQASTSVDHAQGVSLAGGLDWHCPFPAEADQQDFDQGTATLRITVSADAQLRAVQIMRESAAGFGRAAQRCAEARQYRAARDHSGVPAVGSAIVEVRFVR